MQQKHIFSKKKKSLGSYYLVWLIFQSLPATQLFEGSRSIFIEEYFSNMVYVNKFESNLMIIYTGGLDFEHWLMSFYNSRAWGWIPTFSNILEILVVIVITFQFGISSFLVFRRHADYWSHYLVFAWSKTVWCNLFYEIMEPSRDHQQQQTPTVQWEFVCLFTCLLNSVWIRFEWSSSGRFNIIHRSLIMLHVVLILLLHFYCQCSLILNSQSTFIFLFQGDH